MAKYFYKDSRSDNVISVQFLSEAGYVTRLSGGQASRFVAASLYWKAAQPIPEHDFSQMAEMHATRKGRRRRKDPVARYATIMFKQGNNIPPGVDSHEYYKCSLDGPPGWIAIEGQSERSDPTQLKPPVLWEGALTWDRCGTDWRVVSEWASEVEIVAHRPLGIEEHLEAEQASKSNLDQLIYFEDPFGRELMAVKCEPLGDCPPLADLKWLVCRSRSWTAAEVVSQAHFLANFRADYMPSGLLDFPVLLLSRHSDPNFVLTLTSAYEISLP